MASDHDSDDKKSPKYVAAGAKPPVGSTLTPKPPANMLSTKGAVARRLKGMGK